MESDTPPDFDMEHFYMPVMSQAWHDEYDPLTIGLAVLDVYEAFEQEGQTPGSAPWTEDAALFVKQVRPRIAYQLGQYARIGEGAFPFNDDALRAMWRRVQEATETNR